MSSVPGRPVISNCWRSRDEVSALLDFHIKPAMRNKASSDFINKINCIHSLPRDAILGRVDVVDMYLSVPYKIGLKDALR